MTRLPTGTPTRPVFHAGISWPSWNTFGGVVGCATDGQLSLNTLPVRQIDPTYLTTTASPAFSGAPVPLISVFTTSLLGGPDFGMAICGDTPADALTLGKEPPPSVMCFPVALSE